MQSATIAGTDTRQPAALPTGEDAEAQPSTDNTWKKTQIFIWPGIAAACVLIFIAVWIHRLNAREAVNIDNEGILADNAASGNEVEGNGKTGAVTALDSTIFENAYTFTSGDGEEFISIMEDDSVTAVVMECGKFFLSRISITKPVLLAEGSAWSFNSMTITESGCLQVDGKLDISGGCGCYIRLEGSGLRLYVTDSGEIDWSDDTFIWMDDAACLAGKSMNELPMHKLVFSEASFGGQLLSVKDFQSLAHAADLGTPISIDADITLAGDVYFSVPVRISEGVTVRTMDKVSGAWHDMVFGGESIVVNDGTLEGNLITSDNTVVINNGMLDMKMPADGTHASLWAEDESTVVNFGAIDAAGCSRFWDDSLFLNMGSLEAYDLYLVSGNMINFGSAIVPLGSSTLCIYNGSRLYNNSGAELNIKTAAVLNNYGWINNQGDINVEGNGRFNSVLLENSGRFQAKSSADVGGNIAGVYCGDGEYDLKEENAKIYYTHYYDSEEPDNLTEVTNAEELVSALENPAVEAVSIKTRIIMHTDLTVRKLLYIDSPGSLTMMNGAALTDYGSDIVIKDGAALQGSNISLYEDAQINFMGGNLTVDEKGSLTLDRSLLWGWWGSIKISGADLILKDKAGFACVGLTSLDAYGSNITLQDRSVFVTPFEYGKSDFVDAEITLSDNGAGSYFHAVSDTDFKNCSLNVQAGAFRSSAKNLNLYACSVDIDTGGEFISELTNLSLLDGTTLENWSRNVSISGWNEYAFTVYGQVKNHGSMELNMGSIELSEPIDNQGEIYYSVSHYKSRDNKGWNDAYVTGKAAIARP